MKRRKEGEREKSCKCDDKSIEILISCLYALCMWVCGWSEHRKRSQFSLLLWMVSSFESICLLFATHWRTQSALIETVLLLQCLLCALSSMDVNNNKWKERKRKKNENKMHNFSHMRRYSCRTVIWYIFEREKTQPHNTVFVVGQSNEPSRNPRFNINYFYVFWPLNPYVGLCACDEYDGLIRITYVADYWSHSTSRHNSSIDFMLFFRLSLSLSVLFIYFIISFDSWLWAAISFD